MGIRKVLMLPFCEASADVKPYIYLMKRASSSWMHLMQEVLKFLQIPNSSEINFYRRFHVPPVLTAVERRP